jgi:hypothetical protein
MNQAAVVVDLGARGVFSFEFCEVGGLAIIHKRTWPNLATGQRRK